MARAAAYAPISRHARSVLPPDLRDGGLVVAATAAALDQRSGTAHVLEAVGQGVAHAVEVTSRSDVVDTGEAYRSVDMVSTSSTVRTGRDAPQR